MMPLLICRGGMRGGMSPAGRVARRGRGIIRQCGIVIMSLIPVMLLVLVLALPSRAAAQAMNFEQASAMLAASCGTDIDNVCRGVNFDPSRLKDCLRRNDDALSPNCRRDYLRAIGAIEQRVTARASLVRLCNYELNRFCREIRADRIKGLQCLLEQTKKATPNCNKAIDAAGYR